MRDKIGNPIGRRHDNPILDSRIYEVEFSDGEKMALAEKTIEENMFAQVDEQGYRHIIMDEIIDLCTDRTQVSRDNIFVTLRYGTKRRKETTKGWQMLL